MNFKQIEAFRSIMLSGSMTAAAREMHTSQPNISRLISQLELRVGFRLFERVSGRLIPTPEAEALFKDVERAFIGLETIQKSVSNIRKQGTGHLRVGAVPSMSFTIIPEVLQRFSEENDRVRVSLHVGDSLSVAQWTASRYCDVGVSSYMTDTAGVQARLIDTFNAVCIVPPGHRLVDKKTAITPADFDGERFLSLPAGDGTRRTIDKIFAEHGDGRIDICECPYAAAICLMVGRGMGVSIVNPLVASQFLHTGIVVKALTPSPQFPCYGLSSAQYPTSRLGARFNELLAETLSAHEKSIRS